MMDKITDPTVFFPHLGEFAHSRLIEESSTLWAAVAGIGAYLREAILQISSSLESRPLDGTILQNRKAGSAETILIVERLVEIRETTAVKGSEIILGKGVVLEPGALIKGRSLIGAGTEVRHGAYLRGDVLVGEKCTIGHTTEIKNSVFMNHTEAGHFAYVGDSILGSYVNLGAGTKLANLQLRRCADKLKGVFPHITLQAGKERLPIELTKLGAVMGDHSETGCNAVTAPGVFCGAHCWVFANTTLKKGFYPPRTIIR